MIVILVVLLVIVFFGALPVYPYSRGFGYYPSGILGFILVALLILWLLGYLPHQI